jgi:hypothetical protein
VQGNASHPSMNLACISGSPATLRGCVMYRIEVAPGEESVFRTIEELAVGIRNGVVTPRARIYHHASEKWLPIGLHPHYKKALEMPAASSSHAPVTSATSIPTLRPKTHPSSHPKPQSVVHYPEPKRSPEPELTPEPGPETKAAAAPKIPAPVQSPVIAMQNEVLRDLPVISIPEPLPWQVKPSPADAPTVKTHVPVEYTPATQAPVITPPVTHAPVIPAPATHAPVIHAPVAGPVPVAPVPVAPAPVIHPPRTHAPVIHPPVTHAMPNVAAPHAPAPHAPAPRAPERDRPEPYRSMEHRPQVEDRRDPEPDELPPRPTARRSRRMTGRPLLLLGAAAALVAGTHLVLTATPSGSVDPAEAPAAAAEIEESRQPAAATSSAETRATEAPLVTSAPARVSMTPGPAFAGSGPARPGADSARTPKAATHAPAAAPGSAPAPADPSIAPAPASIELAIPGLPPDSVVPTARTGDTMGMKKILRALNGPKPAEGSTAP